MLFHAKVQKPKVKEKYIGILDELSKTSSFDWYKSEQLNNDKAMGQLLDGYFRSHCYYYEDPLDNGVYKNESVIKFIQSNRLLKIDFWTKKIEGKLIQILPVKTIQTLKKIKRKL